MRPDEYAALDGTALAGLVAAGDVSPGEVADAATAAHERVHADLGAVVEWYTDPDPVPGTGPWAGVPTLRKDYGATEAGRLTERGSRLSVGWRAEATSLLFERFRALGLHVRGRSAVPEFILHATTESRLHGITRNPWNADRSAGGSSGGAAAAVAAGVIPVAHASDCAGSIRIPASVCGLVGLKPTRGRVPWADGSTAGGWGGIAEELVVARSVADVATVLAAVGDRRRTRRRPRGRIAVVAGHWAGFSPDPALVAAVEAVGAAAARSGLVVEAVEWPGAYDEVASLMDPLFGAGAAADVAAVAVATGRPIDGDHLEPLTLEYLAAVAELTVADRSVARERAVALTRRLDRWIDRYDAVVCSTLGRASLPLHRLASGPLAAWAAANDEYTPHSFVANVAGWPAVSFPWGRGPDGVPVGVQLLGPRGADERLLGLAAAVQAEAPPLGTPAVWAGGGVRSGTRRRAGRTASRRRGSPQ